MMTGYNIADLFESVADQVSDREAIVAAEKRLTFGELDERSTRAANHLIAAGLQPGARVGIYAWNRAEWVEALLGALKARLVPININYRYVATELAYVFDNADLEALVFERSFAPLVAEVMPRAPKLGSFVVIEDGSSADADFATAYEDALASVSADRPALERSSDDHYVVYTGGTTGMPKGVIWRHEDLFFAALGGDRFGHGRVESPADLLNFITPQERLTVSMAIAPIMHGAAQWTMFFHLLSGNKIVVYTCHSFDPEVVCGLVESERCTNIGLIGDAMARPLADMLDRDPTRYDLASLTTISSAGAIFSKAVKDQLKAHLPTVTLIDAFGSSETGGNSVQIDPTKGPRFPRNDWTDVLGDDLRPVEAGSGVIGRFARRGHIPLGYYKDEAKTAAAFVLDPDGVRWAIPGDHATADADGMITLLGRGSFSINTGGEKVYPEEVEAALKSHPDVFDALVVGMPDERFGEKVAAVVAPREGRGPTLEELATHCRASIAGYKVPRHLVLVDAVGRSASGKGDYAWAKRLVN